MKRLPILLVAGLLFAGCTSGYKQYKNDQASARAKEAMDYVKTVDSLKVVVNDKFRTVLDKIDTVQLSASDSDLISRIRGILEKKEVSEADLMQSMSLISQLKFPAGVTDK